jgi:serpin B
LCGSYQGKWIAEYKECILLETPLQCSLLGGVYNECASACRNDPDFPNVICTANCVEVCSIEFSTLEDIKNHSLIDEFYAKYPDAHEEVRSDHVSYVVGSDDGFKVRMNLHFDENYDLDYINLKCYVNRELQADVPETFISKYLKKFECEKKPMPEPEISDTIDFSKTTNANNQFAIDYYSQVNEDRNIFFSPWSITSAFAIVNEGAKGNTAEEIQNVFGLDENSKENFKAINEILNQENPGYIIEVANSLWLAQDFTLHSDYVDTVQTYYDGKIEKVDFADDGTDVINGWVSDKTRQKIPKLFDPPLDPNTRLVIANAIYFNGTWSMPFDEKNTRDDKFIVSSGVDVTVPFMNKDSFYNHTATEQFQIIDLPYEGNGASMMILLPDRIDGINSLEAQLTAENLVKWRSEMTKSRLFLQIPKFTLEIEYNLVRDLMALGIEDAFGPADFSGISSESLFIDRAVHKAFVDVNEKGTEAAAATGVVMLESMPPTFRADHPFVFVIMDNETGNILFLGKVVDPSQ